MEGIETSAPNWETLLETCVVSDSIQCQHFITSIVYHKLAGLMLLIAKHKIPVSRKIYHLINRAFSLGHVHQVGTSVTEG